MSAVDREAFERWVREHDGSVVWGADGVGTCGVVVVPVDERRLPFAVGVVERSGVVSEVFAGFSGGDLRRLARRLDELAGVEVP